MRSLSRCSALLSMTGIALLLFSSDAQALGISIVDVRSSGASTSTLTAGDTITFDLILENDSNEGVFGLGVAAFGYDPDENQMDDNGLRYVASSASESIFSQVVFEGQPFGGLIRVNEPFEVRNGVQGEGEPEPGRPEPLHVNLLSNGAVAPALATGDGALDVGIDGGFVGDGDAHIRVTFEATPADDYSYLSLTFGVGDPTVSGELPLYSSGALGEDITFLPFENDHWDLEIQPIPEPSTGMLLVLGLCGLAARKGGA